MSTALLGYVKIGNVELGVGTAARCVVEVEATSERKLDEKETDGQNDAVTTDKGEKVANFVVKLEWNRDDPADDAIEEALAQLSPRGPNGGQPMGWIWARSRVHPANACIVLKVKGPIDPPGTTKSTAEIDVHSWAKPQPKAQGAGSTPTAPTPATPPGSPVGYVPPIITPDFTAPGGPSVVP